MLFSSNDIRIFHINKEIMTNQQRHRKLHFISSGMLKTYNDFLHMLLLGKKENSCDFIWCNVIEGEANDSLRGFNFEALCIILTICNCIRGINYTEFLEGKYHQYRSIKNIKDFFEQPIHQGDNDIDLCIKNGKTNIAFSCKYKKKVVKGGLGIVDIKQSFETHIQKNKEHNPEFTEEYKIGLFVKDKEEVLSHKYNNKHGNEKMILDDIVANKLIFDSSDIKQAINVFRNRFCFELSLKKPEEVIDYINENYLNSIRQPLVKKLHQKMVELKFIESLTKQSNNKWCLAHKPRSGKSITLLLLCKHLLANNFAKKILLLTSVPDTLDSFKGDLDKWIDFKDIQYTRQKDIHKIVKDESYTGIIMCSVQYFKTDKSKKTLLENLNVDVIVADESHFATSTQKTENNIIEVDTDVNNDEINPDVEALCNKAKMCIFASGTARKTLHHYKISRTNTYEWDLYDEAFMKNATSEILSSMEKRHGTYFTLCLNDQTLNRDYSKYPTLVTKRFKIPNTIEKQINEYNLNNKTDFGMSTKSLLALQVKDVKEDKKTKTKKISYLPKFILDKENDGKELLSSFLEEIVSSNKMKQTVLKKCELTQSDNKSRLTSKKEPQLILMYLPVNTGNGTIDMLQEALKSFVEEHNLWKDYYVAYKNSKEDSESTSENFNGFRKNIIENAKKQNKRGCILLLGNVGRVGITYHDCDITISLDDGHNIDQFQQSISRALTEEEGKTIGISFDMNVQRYYNNNLRMILELKKRLNRPDMTNAEVMCYAFRNNIFIVGGDQFENPDLNDINKLTSLYNKEAEEISNQIDDDYLLSNLDYDEDTLKNVINIELQKRNYKLEMPEANDALKGLQPELNPGKTKPKVLSNNNEDNNEEQTEKTEEEEKEEEEIKNATNETLELFRNYMVPLIALMCIRFKINNIKDLLETKEAQTIIMSVIKYPQEKIDLKKCSEEYIIQVIITMCEKNNEIIQQIREIYQAASSKKLRELIAKHFKPTEQEKKDHAEIPTPVKLVDEMLDKIEADFWKQPRRVYEPCCGKGNFVLAIFDRFFEGLADTYPDEIERCKVIATECIYFADISHLNVFITTELLKCHIQSYCGLETIDYQFNSYAGDTLKMDITEVWGIDGFDAVIGNPPFNDKNGNKGTGNTLWNLFVENALNKWLIEKGLLLFVHPRGWRQQNSKVGALMKSKQIRYLNMNSVSKGLEIFKCATDYDYYVIENTDVYKDTIVNDYKNKEYQYMINTDLLFIPNHSLVEVYKLVNIVDDNGFMNDQSSYEPRKKWMSKVQSDEYKYPCVYSINSKNEISKKWSSRNNNGHFGITKFIFSNGNGLYKDCNGDYGLTQWAYAIKCKKEDMDNVEKAFNNNNFKKIVDAINLTSNKYNYNVLKMFKKDFWKEFI